MQGLTFTREFGDNYTSVQALWGAEIKTNSTNTQPKLYTGTAPCLLNNAFFIGTTGENPLSDTGLELVCRMYNTSYLIKLNFTNGTQSLTTLAVSPINPAHWTYGESQHSSLPSNHRGETRSPYTPNSGVHITHLLFRGLLQRRLRAGSTGNLAQDSDSKAWGDRTPLPQSGLFSCPGLWNSSIYGNLTPTAVVKPSLLSLNSANTSVPVFASSPQNIYTDDCRNVAAAYAAAVGVTVACVAVGFLALVRNALA
ncbi:hypothetical protein BJX68DRAFT_261715 [Aspergillus pseudodeflectus]|uniref:Uncharacterized protein n=1 Tax=Aspergillus pseudodeflectus TaxID=176178 RepID=A0ABR4L726_9EURO